jgi:septal ring factor EnvC (AmiA/AmiB activator)
MHWLGGIRGASLVKLILFAAFFAYAAPKEIIEVYRTEKQRLIEAEKASRDLMSEMYAINTRMKAMSKQRDKTNNKLIDVQSRAQALAKEIVRLQTLKDTQRRDLSKCLKALYKIGENQLMQLIFSATSSQELYQNIKYMRLITESDYRIIQEHKETIVKLDEVNKRFRVEIKKLLGVRQALRKQEELLEKEQSSKGAVLAKINKAAQRTKDQLFEIRNSVNEGDINTLNLSFFEKRGQIPSPVSMAQLATGFGVIEHPEFGYRLSHKGLSFTGQGDVRAVFSGQIVFNDELDGYGRTLIIDHGDHYYSVYANLKDSNKVQGQKVEQGQVLSQFEGRVYFEIRHFSDAVDPLLWLADGAKNETKL